MNQFNNINTSISRHMTVFKIFCTNFVSLYKSYRQIQIALISIWYLLHYNRQYLSCFALFLRKCDNSWTWLYVKSTIKRHIHYPTEKNIVTVIKTVLKQIVFVFPCNHILWEMKSIKFELAKILNSDNENKWIKSLWQNDVQTWIVEK